MAKGASEKTEAAEGESIWETVFLDLALGWFVL